MKTLLHSLRKIFSKPAAIPPDALVEMTEAYRQRMRLWPQLGRASRSARRVGVLVTPWMKTAVPFFSLELARTFAENGWRVVALLDGSDVAENIQNGEYQTLKDLLQQAGDWLAFREFVGGAGLASDLDVGERLARANAVRNMRGEELAHEFHKRRPEAARAIADHFRGVVSLLEDLQPDRLLISGGVYGVSGCYVEAARRLKIDFQTFDSGAGLVRLCHNGVAAHLGDIPAAYGALSVLARENSALEQKIVSIAEAEFEDRTQCRDFRHFQLAPRAGAGIPGFTVLVPLNISWDGAALNLKGAFSTTREWIGALMSWLERSPGITLCIRQHPRERLGFARSNDDLGAFVAGFTHLAGRVRFIGAEAAVNTYDLLEQAQVVLPHSSTFGIEAAFSGKPVVVATDCYYSDLGFVRRGLDPETYFRAVEEALQTPPPAKNRRRAALAYFLTQRCTFLKTNFTPMPDDFRHWSSVPRDELWTGDGMPDLQSSLLGDEPFPLVRARSLLRWENAPAEQCL